MSAPPITDKFFRSVVVLTVSPGSDRSHALVSWFCDNSPQSVYKCAKSHSRANTDIAFFLLLSCNFVLTSQLQCCGDVGWDSH